MLRLENTQFVYEPFPIGIVPDVFEHSWYQQLTAAFPPKDLFEFKPELGNKYSLSELNHPDAYHQFVKSSPIWRNFHSYVKAPSFAHGILEHLREHNIDLGVRTGRSTSRLHQLRERVRALKYGRVPHLSARFEFSMLPADGGYIKPHTDSPQKIVTLVASMRGDGEWEPAHGGGTEMLRPKDTKQSFNLMNRYLNFDDVETLRTFEYLPNSCVIFIKTFNSWHAVRPMLGVGRDVMRKTLTINLELT